MTHQELADALRDQAKRIKTIARDIYGEIDNDSHESATGRDYRLKSSWASLTNTADILRELAQITEEGRIDQ